MPAFAIYAAAALAEIAGCFAVWLVLRQGQSLWWLLPGMASLAVFAWLRRLAPQTMPGAPLRLTGALYRRLADLAVAG